MLTSALLCLALLTACSSDLLSADAGLADRLPPDYDELDVWSCHPDLDSSPCTREYEVTEVVEGGQTRTFSVGAATDPEVDCFYVHPTIGEDRGRNGDLSLDEGEDRIVWEQAALLRGSCRVFAPVFREATFRNGTPDGMTSDELDLAYGDVADAFRAYLDNWNEGRPFVVVGHSQGATLLLRLLAEVIEVDAGLRSSLVGAYLPGLGIAVDDSAVPVDVPTLPLCTELGQQHCLVAFSAYDAARPPGDDALFGRPWNTDGPVACVNPAAVDGGVGTLEPYVSKSLARELTPRARNVSTELVALPGVLSAVCIDDGPLTYLQVSYDGDGDGTPDRIPLDDDVGWGLHSIEMQLVAGNLRALIAAQVAAR